MNTSTLQLSDYRCTCGRLLFKGVLRTGQVEIKCKRCHALSRFGPETEGAIISPYMRREGVPTALLIHDAPAPIHGVQTHRLCIRVDAHWYCTYISEDLLTRLGSTHGGVVGKSILEIFESEDATRFREIFATFAKDGAPVRIEDIHFVANKTNLPVLHLIAEGETPTGHTGYTLVFEEPETTEEVDEEDTGDASTDSGEEAGSV